MTVDDHTLTDRSGAQGPGGPPPIQMDRGRRGRYRRPTGRGRLRKLRLLVILVGFVIIAGIAFMFGVLTSVASDLHVLSNQVQYQKSTESVLYDDTGKVIGTLAPSNDKVIVRYGQISKNMINAIVSTEDKDFWTDPGIDLKSIGRAAFADLFGGEREGASTIAEEFVKNALAEEDNRTPFEKLREAGLAFQLVHHWTRPRILDQYLNIIYFGNGAYGIEAAARTYFGKQLGYDAANPSKGRCGSATAADPHMPTCASLLKPYQAATLAAMVANPTEFDPVVHQTALRQRRNQVVLRNMYIQGYISAAQYARAKVQPLPTESDIEQASEPAAAPYFTSWVRPLIIRALEKEGVSAKDAPYEAYYGGLKIKLSVNLQMQAAAQDAVDSYFPTEKDSPTATLVSIDNQNGEVRAMVSGDGNYNADPFNLATLGYRQPGSSFKLFTLIDALESGKYGPDSVIDSHALDIAFKGPDGATEHFIVHNDEDSYLGPITLQEATDVSDNTVFAQVGMSLGTQSIRKQAELLGVRSPISTNPAMIIGGLTHGVSALDMAHAYSTEANDGVKVYNPVLGDLNEGAVGIDSITGCDECNQHTITNDTPKKLQAIPPVIAADVHSMLEGVVTSGTGTAAAIPGQVVAGKTGTTSNYVDAWFCGWTSALTTCVWVGYPDSGKPMTTLYNGGPVTGGTFPALIWHGYMESALDILAGENAPDTPSGSGTTPSEPTSGSTSAETGTTGAVTGNTGDGTDTAATAGDTGAGTAATAGNTGAGTQGATDQTAGTGGTADTTPAAATPTPATTATPAPATGSGASGNTGSAGSGTTGGAGLGG